MYYEKSVVAVKCENASDAETLKLFTSVVTRASRIAIR
jgi:hypothetical protein